MSVVAWSSISLMLGVETESQWPNRTTIRRLLRKNHPLPLPNSPILSLLWNEDWVQKRQQWWKLILTSKRCLLKVGPKKPDYHVWKCNCLLGRITWAHWAKAGNCKAREEDLNYLLCENWILLQFISPPKDGMQFLFVGVCVCVCDGDDISIRINPYK